VLYPSAPGMGMPYLAFRAQQNRLNFEGGSRLCFHGVISAEEDDAPNAGTGQGARDRLDRKSLPKATAEGVDFSERLLPDALHCLKAISSHEEQLPGVGVAGFLQCVDGAVAQSSAAKLVSFVDQVRAKLALADRVAPHGGVNSRCRPCEVKIRDVIDHVYLPFQCIRVNGVGSPGPRFATSAEEEGVSALPAIAVNGLQRRSWPH
jgi:hypothetical protein